MKSLGRASWFVNKACQFALGIAFLATWAIPAHGSTTFDTGGTCTVYTFNGVGSCGVFQQATTGDNPEANWVALEGFGSSCCSGALYVSFVYNGSASGSLSSGALPVSWDFTVEGAPMPVNWQVTYTLDFTGGGTASFSQSGSSDAEVTGSGLLSESGGTLTGYSIQLGTSIANGAYGINIPDGSTIDLNTAPEPATLYLIPGAVSLLLLRRKSKLSSY